MPAPPSRAQKSANEKAMNAAQAKAKASSRDDGSRGAVNANAPKSSTASAKSGVSSTARGSLQTQRNSDVSRTISKAISGRSGISTPTASGSPRNNPVTARGLNEAMRRYNTAAPKAPVTARPSYARGNPLPYHAYYSPEGPTEDLTQAAFDKANARPSYARGAPLPYHAYYNPGPSVFDKRANPAMTQAVMGEKPPAFDSPNNYNQVMSILTDPTAGQTFPARPKQFTDRVPQQPETGYPVSVARPSFGRGGLMGLLPSNYNQPLPVAPEPAQGNAIAGTEPINIMPEAQRQLSVTPPAKRQAMLSRLLSARPRVRPFGSGGGNNNSLLYPEIDPATGLRRRGGMRMGA